MLNVYFLNKTICCLNNEIDEISIRKHINDKMLLENCEYYLLINGLHARFDEALKDRNIHVVLRLNGGKGGFGSMLRAIGAQIEKTTNREACRDLSGRRLRDINEEKRLKNWIAAQAEREKEAEDRKQKKLERLCREPKHEFKDEKYDKERSALPEKVEDAVLQGLKASVSCKRKHPKEDDVKGKKKKLWIDEEFDDLSTDDEEELQSKKDICDANSSRTDKNKQQTIVNASEEVSVEEKETKTELKNDS